MPARCEGCGKTGTPAKVRSHILECPDWNALPSDQQLGPEDSHEHWLAEGKQAEREQRKTVLAEREVTLRTAADDRWRTPKDILED